MLISTKTLAKTGTVIEKYLEGGSILKIVKLGSGNKMASEIKQFGTFLEKGKWNSFSVNGHTPYSSSTYYNIADVLTGPAKELQKISVRKDFKMTMETFNKMLLNYRA